MKTPSTPKVGDVGLRLRHAAYAFNRDQGNCRICGDPIWPEVLQVHHLSPKLPTEQVNKVSNLASLHKQCHRYLHHPDEIPFNWDESRSDPETIPIERKARIRDLKP
ncbi:MAG: HNH endonuclease [Firmicutes bacterium]|nr:HNH endonuclease [Bacillota bacterium]